MSERGYSVFVNNDSSEPLEQDLVYIVLVIVTFTDYWNLLYYQYGIVMSVGKNGTCVNAACFTEFMYPSLHAAASG